MDDSLSDWGNDLDLNNSDEGGDNFDDFGDFDDSQASNGELKLAAPKQRMTSGLSSMSPGSKTSVQKPQQPSIKEQISSEIFSGSSQRSQTQSGLASFQKREDGRLKQTPTESEGLKVESMGAMDEEAPDEELGSMEAPRPEHERNPKSLTIENEKEIRYKKTKYEITNWTTREKKYH